MRYLDGLLKILAAMIVTVSMPVKADTFFSLHIGFDRYPFYGIYDYHNYGPDYYWDSFWPAYYVARPFATRYPVYYILYPTYYYTFYYQPLFPFYISYYFYPWYYTPYRGQHHYYRHDHYPDGHYYSLVASNHHDLPLVSSYQSGVSVTNIINTGDRKFTGSYHESYRVTDTTRKVSGIDRISNRKIFNPRNDGQRSAEGTAMERETIRRTRTSVTTAPVRIQSPGPGYSRKSGTQYNPARVTVTSRPVVERRPSFTSSSTRDRAPVIRRSTRNMATGSARPSPESRPASRPDRRSVSIATRDDRPASYRVPARALNKVTPPRHIQEVQKQSRPDNTQAYNDNRQTRRQDNPRSSRALDQGRRPARLQGFRNY